MPDSVAFRYLTWATLTVRQPFYADGLARKHDLQADLDFDIAPTAECDDTMRRLDLIFRRSDRTAGATVLGRVLGKNAAADDLVRFTPRSADKLTFWMRLRNPDVINFDDLPTQLDSARIYYFTNQRQDAGAARDDLHLSSAANGVDANQDRIARSMESYTFHHNAEVAPGAAKVTHLLTGTELAPTSIANKSGQSDLAFDLHALPLGRCELAIGGVVKDTFYFLPSSEPQQFGLIELVLGSALDANYRIVEADRSLTSARPVYSIRFANRKTRWRYTVSVSPSGPLATDMAGLSDADKAAYLSHLNVTTNDTAITFAPATANDRLLVFVSNGDIALREQYISSSQQKPLALSLVKNAGSGNDVVRSDLPYPLTSSIDARTAPPVYSDTFLTI